MRKAASPHTQYTLHTTQYSVQCIRVPPIVHYTVASIFGGLPEQFAVDPGPSFLIDANPDPHFSFYSFIINRLIFKHLKKCLKN